MQYGTVHPPCTNTYCNLGLGGCLLTAAETSRLCNTVQYTPLYWTNTYRNFCLGGRLFVDADKGKPFEHHLVLEHAIVELVADLG